MMRVAIFKNAEQRRGAALAAMANGKWHVANGERQVLAQKHCLNWLLAVGRGMLDVPGFAVRDFAPANP
jgi:hypothetical protein